MRRGPASRRSRACWFAKVAVIGSCDLGDLQVALTWLRTAIQRVAKEELFAAIVGALSTLPKLALVN